MNKQQAEILEILRESGATGMNSYKWRMKFIQLPVRIKELKQQGFLITAAHNKDRSVNYILIPELNTLEKSKEVVKEYVWVRNKETNTFRQIRKDALQRQESLFESPREV